ncbi:MAG: segregation/condensation protein A [Acidobacteriaceae bacterium]|nr:segregation/condensation protein A [Acidobacteriaceae bacterium]
MSQEQNPEEQKPIEQAVEEQTPETSQQDSAAQSASVQPAETAAAAAPFALEHPPVPAPLPEPRQKTDKEKAKEEASQSPFLITVGRVYDGPMDLLLDLIRKQNIDIYDIPIAKITAQFLEYTHRLKQTDVDSAGEFVYTASLLIHIKSKMLLPRDPMEVAAGLDEDPRRELVERLLEHERFKSAAQMLLQKQQIEDATWTHSGMKAFLQDEGISSLDAERELDADTSTLLLVFRDVLQKLRERPIHKIDEETVTVAQMIQYVKQRLLMEDRPVSLRKLLGNARTERALICTFLAMLELVRLQAVLFRQPEVLGDILLKKTDQFEQVINENAAVRDDWT